MSHGSPASHNSGVQNAFTSYKNPGHRTHNTESGTQDAKNGTKTDSPEQPERRVVHKSHNGRRQCGGHQSELQERVELADQGGLQPGRGEGRVKVPGQGHLRQGQVRLEEIQ